MSAVAALAQARERRAMEALWKTAFPADDETDIARFFDMFFEEALPLVVREDGQVVSMLFVLPTAIVINGRSYPAGYVYAGATHPDCRCRGYYRRLLSFACDLASQRGLCALFLRPADDALAQSYRRLGFTVPMTCRTVLTNTVKGHVPCGEDLSAAAYIALRRRLLKTAGASFVDWDEHVAAYALTWCRAVTLDTRDCALLSKDGDRTVVWEYLGATDAPRNLPLADEVRMPGGGTPVGCLYPIDTELWHTAPPVYMGYALE